MTNPWTSALPITIGAALLLAALIIVADKARSPNSGELLLPGDATFAAPFS